MALRPREEYELLFSRLRELYPDVDLPIIKADDSLELIDCKYQLATLQIRHDKRLESMRTLVELLAVPTSSDNQIV